ncbi:MAG: BMP family ABC transporter substrate-binding protein [Armatimonadetes bacterium]|nr:BMP family ABC transporter substrate-binding protein [Armatimonadota bacterium]
MLVLFGCNGTSGGGSEATGGGAQATGGAGKSGAKSDLKVGIVYDSGGINDGSFNQSANRGVDRAANELGVQVNKVESKTAKDFASNIEGMAAKGCNLVFAVGITMNDALKEVAAKFPEVKFAIVDGDVDLPNVRSLRFAEHEGSFLAGFAAALASKSHKLGFVGGMEIPLIKKFYAGYVAGAHMADPTITVLPPKYVGDWVSQDKGKAAAALLFSEGADVVYHAAGKGGLGVISAAKEQNKLAIGVDSDQDAVEKGFVLTSMVKKVDESVFSTIQDLVGGKFSAGAKVYDLKSKGVSLTDFQYTKDKLPADGLKRITEIEAKIVSGEIMVPSDEAQLTEFLAKLPK